MAFDECTEYPADRSRTQASMELTVRWAERSKKYFEEHKHEVPWKKASSVESPVSGATNTGNRKLETAMQTNLSSASSRAAWTLPSARNPPSVPSRSAFPAMPSAG